MKKLLTVVHSIWNWIVSLWKKLFGKAPSTDVPKKIKKHIELWIGKHHQSKGVGITIDVSTEESSIEKKLDKTAPPDEYHSPDQDQDAKGKRKKKR